MKKNLMFKLGLLCAALVLVATCFVTGAWAKYTTTVSGTDTARVALFDVSVAGIQNNKVELFKTTYGDNVKAATNVVAPGTEGSVTITLTGTSEVTIEYTLSGTETNTANIPLKWSTNGATWGTLTEALASVTGTVNAGTAANVSTTLQWKWVFDGGVDPADTTLGVKGTDTISVTLTYTAEQVD